MTKIEWTETTWNPIVGCSLASPGCTNCYAMRFAGTRLAHLPKYDGLTQPSKAGPVWTGKLAFDEKALLEPLRWKKPRMVFVNSMGDLFHEDCPDEWIDRVFAVMALCPQHNFQVLTKRSGRMREYISFRNRWSYVLDQQYDLRGSGFRTDWPIPNVWLGVSVEDQQRADERIPDLLATPAAVRWISAEPLLGPVDLTNITGVEKSRDYGSPVHGWSAIWVNNGIGRKWLDWVVVGGESGKGARPMHPDWARSMRDQCAAAGVPFFFKQWGEWVPRHSWGERRMVAIGPQGGEIPDDVVPQDVGGQRFAAVGKKRAGRLLDGVEHNAMPGLVNA